MIYGYCRCSTDKQTIDNQIFEIEKYCKIKGMHIDRWIVETISSRKPLNKRKLGVLLKGLKESDILIATELSRIGRSLLEVMGILQQCLDKGCQICTIKENYCLGADISSKVLAFAFGLSAEIERNLISNRTKMSLDKLKNDGIKLGRPIGSKTKQLKLAKNKRKIAELLQKGISKNQICKIMNVSKGTLYRFIQNYMQ